MTKEPWNRPTAQQLVNYIDRYLEGENPPVTWGHVTKSSQPENPVETPAVQPPVPEVKKTVLNKEPQNPMNASPVPEFAEEPAKKQSNLYPAWVWAVVPMAGLIVGFLVKLLVG
jgi:hypothetical protein